VFCVDLCIGHFESALVEARVAPPMVDALVVTREIPMGGTVTAEDLKVVQYPAGTLTLAPVDPKGVVGRVVAERLLPGDPIREERLVPADAGHDLEALLAKGMRAQSVNLAAADTVSGFLNPGDRVDVIATVLGNDGLPPETRTILRGVRVLGIDDRLLASETRGVRLKEQVTLEVLPNEAEILAHADRTGPLRLSVIGLSEQPSRLAAR
jgi:pilus assembly protein CpaB